MNYDAFSVWASARGIAQRRVRAVYEDATEHASRHSRTTAAYWKTLAASIREQVGAAPNVRAAPEIQKLESLASWLKTQPGSTSFVDEGRELVLRYSRDSTHGLAYPFSDFCDIVIGYDPVLNMYRTGGYVFGTAVNTPSANDAGVFLMASGSAAAQYNAAVRDFLTRAMKICERYGGNNLDLFTFQLGRVLRASGTVTKLDNSKLPNVAEYRSGTAEFSAWFARSNLGLGVIKFNPAASTGGYPVSTRTFVSLLAALDEHVQAHQDFVNACLAATNRTSA